MEPFVLIPSAEPSADWSAQLSNIEKKKNLLKTKLIKYLYANGPQTNADVFTALNISSPTSQSIINELVAENLLEKKGKGVSVGGRKPDLFGLKDHSYFVLSIDMERFKTKVAILDNNHHNITGIKSYPIAISKDFSAIDELYTIVQELILSSGIDADKLIGIGISMPGLIDANSGDNYSYLLSIEDGKTLQERLEEKFGRPVYIQNDVKSATIAECRHGLARGKSNALVVLMDWGIGLGIVMDGQLRKGTRGFSGEIGHIPFVEEGALCYCGKRGCLETVASGIALARMAKEGIKSGQYSILNQLSDQEIDKIEPHIVIDAANKGDQYAINILSQVGISLGKGIATLIQLFNPEVIILGGKIAEAKQYITIPILHSINTYSMTEIRKNVKVVLSDLGDTAGILGTVNTVFDHIFDAKIRDLER